MEVDETQTQASKFSRVANGKIDSSKIGTGAGGAGSSSLIAVEGGCAVDGSRLRSWQHSSRIIRVSRASGGKDRHSKVWTAKGPRDRRVRLSVATAIQFYDLQDRLGVDQPSKAVEWLIKAASDSIAELPSLDGAFPETPRQQSDENRPELGGNNVEQGFDSSAELELDGDRGFAAQTQQQHGSNLSKSSACSSNSETSKGSGGLSLSRNEIRVKARERARERTAKERETETGVHQQNQNDVNHQMTQSSSSFTQLLTAGIGNMENAGVSSSSMENYFNATGLMGSSGSSTARGGVHHSSSGFTGQIIQLGNSGIPQGMMAVSPFSIDGENHHHPHPHPHPHHQNQNHHHELQHFPFVADHHLVVPGASNADHYNLNFTISPSSTGALAAGFNNRGTLQSNSSQSLLPQLQRFSSSQLDHATTLPFFLGAAIENQHQQNQHQSHQQGASLFPHGLQQYYGGNNGGRQSDQKGKGKH